MDDTIDTCQVSCNFTLHLIHHCPHLDLGQVASVAVMCLPSPPRPTSGRVHGEQSPVSLFCAMIALSHFNSLSVDICTFNVSFLLMVYPVLTHYIRARAGATLGLGVRDNHNLDQHRMLSSTYHAPHTLWIPH